MLSSLILKMIGFLSPSFTSSYCFTALVYGDQMVLRNLVITERSVHAFLSFLSIIFANQFEHRRTGKRKPRRRGRKGI